jgi:hypothetical protein
VAFHNWRQKLKKILTSHVAMMRPRKISFQPPSTNIVFTKYPSVMDSLRNHKEMATRRADSETPACTCSLLCLYLATPPTHADHIALDGDTSHFDCQPLTSIATGSLQNKIFPPLKEIFKLLTTAFDIWHRKSALLWFLTAMSHVYMG